MHANLDRESPGPVFRITIRSDRRLGERIVSRRVSLSCGPGCPREFRKPGCESVGAREYLVGELEQ